MKSDFSKENLKKYKTPALAAAVMAAAGLATGWGAAQLRPVPEGIAAGAVPQAGGAAQDTAPRTPSLGETLTVSSLRRFLETGEYAQAAARAAEAENLPDSLKTYVDEYFSSLTGGDGREP